MHSNWAKPGFHVALSWKTSPIIIKSDDFSLVFNRNELFLETDFEKNTFTRILNGNEGNSG